MTSLDTPVAVVDLDRLDRNLERWQAHCDAVGLLNRPHVQTHCSVEIAQRQLALGAVGITCQKLGEAEVMVDAGLTDILVPYNIVGERAGGAPGQAGAEGAPGRRARPVTVTWSGSDPAVRPLDPARQREGQACEQRAGPEHDVTGHEQHDADEDHGDEHGQGDEKGHCYSFFSGGGGSLLRF
ncbi:MAG TPA: hypothetical protein VF073_01750 [Gaiella sp.]